MKLSDSDRTLLRIFFRTNSEWLADNIENKEEIKKRFIEFATQKGEDKHVCKVFVKSLNGKIPSYAKTRPGKIPHRNKCLFFENIIRGLFEPVFITEDPVLGFWEKQSRDAYLGDKGEFNALSKSVAEKVEAMKNYV